MRAVKPQQIEAEIRRGVDALIQRFDLSPQEAREIAAAEVRRRVGVKAWTVYANASRRTRRRQSNSSSWVSSLEDERLSMLDSDP